MRQLSSPFTKVCLFVALCLVGCGGDEADNPATSEESEDDTTSSSADKKKASAGSTTKSGSPTTSGNSTNGTGASDKSGKASSGGASTTPTTSGPASPGTPKADPAGTPIPCNAQAVAGLDTIGELVTAINALPMPVNLPCILALLPRPLGVTASSSNLSVQPAGGPSNPRIFLRVGDLVLAIVPGGEAKDLLEMSELQSDDMSIKAEIALPVTKPLSATEPFTRIKRLDGTPGTSCVGCHADESATTSYEGKGFVSRALRMLPNSVVSHVELQALARACIGQNTDRCAVINALKLGEAGQTIDQPFPTGMPTMF